MMILFITQQNKIILIKNLKIHLKHNRFMTSGKMPPSLGGTKQPKLPVETKSSDFSSGTPNDPLFEHHPSSLDLVQDSTKTPPCDYTPSVVTPAKSSVSHQESSMVNKNINDVKHEVESTLKTAQKHQEVSAEPIKQDITQSTKAIIGIAPPKTFTPKSAAVIPFNNEIKKRNESIEQNQPSSLPAIINSDTSSQQPIVEDTTSFVCNQQSTGLISALLDSLTDDSFIPPMANIPLPPPPLPSTPKPATISSMTETLQDQLKDAVQKRMLKATEIAQKLDMLEKGGLYDIERNVLTRQFYFYYNKITIPSEKITLDISLEDIKQAYCSIGLLAINNDRDDENILLLGTQTHVVIFFTILNGNKIVTGYLTSEKEKGNLILSETQPFPRESGVPLDSPQLYKPVKPFVIRDEDLAPLPKETSEIGSRYLQQNEIKNKIQKHVEDNFVELKKPLDIFNGRGVTLDVMDLVLTEQAEEAKFQAKKLFEKYESKRKITPQKANDWLHKLQNDNKSAYPYVKKLVDEKYK